MTRVSVGTTLRRWRDWKTSSVEELAAVGTAFVWALALEPQPETTASGQISRRTIRYYISNGVMDPPEGERRLATYDYRHLLQVLYIKLRQHAGDRLEDIRADIEGAGRDDLEARLIESLPATVPPPLPDDPSEFARPANLAAVLRRWAYQTGRIGRWPSSAMFEPSPDIREKEVPQRIEAQSVAPLERFEIDADRAVFQELPRARGWASRRRGDRSSAGQLRHQVHIPIGDGVELTVPADHPLAHDEDGREFVLRGIRRLIRSYLQGGPAGKEG
jgi:DNA-binding transcriptional MerR regulator